jgi:transforming growth factor-beta-induced protein
MKNLKKNLSVLIAMTVVLSLSVPALAGSCGSSAKHTHDEEASLQAIYPLAEEAGFTTLVAAVKAAGLDMTLTNDGPFTVFAPTDEAFAKLPKGTVENLLANPEQLKKVLLYHVVSGNVMASDVIKLDSAKTLNGTNVAINTKDGVRINTANVIKTDIEAKKRDRSRH